MFVFFLCYSLTRHENPLEIFPYGDPPVPTGKLGKLTPLSRGKSDPFRGGGVWIFSGTTQTKSHSFLFMGNALQKEDIEDGVIAINRFKLLR